MEARSDIEDRNRLNFSWLLKLRWSQIAGQIATIVAVEPLTGVQVPLGPLFVILAIQFASNVSFAVWFSRRPDVGDIHFFGVMAFDIALLTGLLYFTGGPFNPFAFLYLVNIALAAVLLHRMWTWALVGFTLLSFGGLSLVDYWPLPLEYLSPGERVALLTRGMWVAFAVAAAFIVHFLWRVSGALIRRERELAEARAVATRQERLASLATMAGGAAHELATPLGTIALVAKELERELGTTSVSPGALDDLRLIREQVARCRLILDQMAGGVGVSSEQSVESVTFSELLNETLEGLREAPAVDVSVDPVAREHRLSLPPRAVAQALRSLITNAQDASPPDTPVFVRASVGADNVRIEVEDHGPGMAPHVLSRAGEPFFTTKEPGRGMGLGLFLTRAVIEKLGGSMSLSSQPGAGTRVEVNLPA